MKRFLIFLCAVTMSGAVLSAQNADTIKVSRHNSDTFVIIVKEKHTADRQTKKAERLAEKAQKPKYMVNVGYRRGYRADIELSSALTQQMGISSSHGFSFGNGLYVGGGAGFGAEFIPDFNAVPTYVVPVFADIKYSFNETIVTPFVSMKGGAIADITNTGLRTFANPAVGLDIARFSLRLGYEYQLGFWGHLDGIHSHKVKIGIAYTF